MLDSLFARRKKSPEPSREARPQALRGAPGRRSGPNRREVSVDGNLLQALLSSRNLLLAIKDLDGRYVEVNEAYARAIGVDAAAIRGRLDRDLLPPDIAGELAQRERLAMRGVVLKPEREAFDREPPAFLVERIPIRDEEGEMCAVCLLAMDFRGENESAGGTSPAGASLEALDEVASPVPQPAGEPMEAVAPVATPVGDEVEAALAGEGVVLVGVASPAEREALGSALTGEGFAIATAATASEILLHCAGSDLRSAPPGIIFVDELLVRDDGKRQAFLAAIEALLGGLTAVVPVVAKGAPGAPWRTATSETQPPMIKGVPASGIRAVLRALRASTLPEERVPSAPGGGAWLCEPAASGQLEWDAALYSSLLARFGQRYQGFAGRAAEHAASGELPRLESELGQLSRGARNLGAVPLADLAARILGTLQRDPSADLTALLAELSRALEATSQVIDERVRTTSDPFEWADPTELASATGRARERSAA